MREGLITEGRGELRKKGMRIEIDSATNAAVTTTCHP
jgi:hypothetical protein